MDKKANQVVEEILTFLRAAAEGRFEKIEQSIVKLALETLGATFEDLSDTDIENIGMYTNFRKGKAIRKALPKGKRIQFNRWNKAWVDEHKAPLLVPLPERSKPKEQKSNYEGPKGFFYTLFSYAVGAYTWELMYIQYLVRTLNYDLRANGMKKKQYRLHIMHPGYDVAEMVYASDGTQRTKEVPFAPASLDKQYCADLADFLEGWIE